MVRPVAEGIIVATATPYTKDLKPDREGVKWLVGKLAEAGVDGVFMPGTTGEWPLLSRDEKREVLEAAIEAAGGKLKIIAVLSGATTEEAVEAAKMARELDVAAVSATPPLYFRPSPEKLAEHFYRVAEAADKPLVIYTIPANVGYNVPVELMYRMAVESSLIAGVKATVDDLHYVQRLVAEVKASRPDFAVITGYGEYLLDTLLAGGDGAVDAYSNLVPKLTASIVKAWREGDLKRAMELHRLFIRIPSAMRGVTCLQSAVKSLLARLGAPVLPHVRPPLRPEAAETVELLHSILCSRYREYLVTSEGCG